MMKMIETVFYVVFIALIAIVCLVLIPFTNLPTAGIPIGVIISPRTRQPSQH